MHSYGYYLYIVCKKVTKVCLCNREKMVDAWKYIPSTTLHQPFFLRCKGNFVTFLQTIKGIF